MISLVTKGMLGGGPLSLATKGILHFFVSEVRGRVRGKWITRKEWLIPAQYSRR